jgi:ABC-2 type transport system ATP-binding protein
MNNTLKTIQVSQVPSVTIKLKDLKISYENQVALICKEAQFTGNIIALIGHNGAGKSTFLKTLLGLLLPKEGTVEVTAGESSAILRPEQDIAFCPESGSVFSDITVRQYVELWCRLKKKEPYFYKTKEGQEVIKQMDMGPLMGKLGRELSKGQRRRVQTAVGFLIEPKLFLIDEPFDGLDVQHTHKLTAFIRSLSQNMAFVISSHRMDVMERLADFVIVLHQGGVKSSGSVSKVAEDLAGRTFVMDADEDHEKVQKILTSTWKESVVNLLGGYITITGDRISIDELSAVTTVDKDKIRIVTPTLVDAMTYHLKNSTVASVDPKTP